MSDHPLVGILRRAASGELPEPDGKIEVLSAPPGPVDAVIGFTAHLVVAGAVEDDHVRGELPPGDFSAWMHPSFLLWIGDRLGSRPGSHDLVLAAPGSAEPADLDLKAQRGHGDHPRVRRAARYRADVRVFSDPDEQSVLVLGRGLAGRWELAFEVEPSAQRRGLGRRLALAARSQVGDGEAIFAQVAPGNAASVRAVLAAGFRPIGSEVLFPRTR